MAQRGQHLLGVRLDSGDMTALSRDVRAILDTAGLPDVRIVASGGFDEYAIAQAIEKGARIDVFGVGAKMGVAADAPYADMAYKLVKYDGRPVMKLSSGKATLVEEKQVWRRTCVEQDLADIIALRHENLDGSDARPLLTCVMQAGRLSMPLPDLDASRAYHAEQIARLPLAYKQLEPSAPYPVALSPELERAQREAEAAIRGKGHVANDATRRPPETEMSCRPASGRHPGEHAGVVDMRTEVENAIHAALARCPQLETPSVNIHVEDGTVTLSGCVGAWTEKLAILEAVRHLPGSQAVEGALQIAVYL